MKQASLFIQLLLIFLCNALFAQKHPYVKALQHHPEAAAFVENELLQQKIMDRSGTNRLDSSTFFINYVGLDSLRTGYSLYSYPDAYTILRTNYSFNNTTGVWEANSFNTTQYDALNRTILLEQAYLNNGVITIGFQVKIFPRGNSLTQLDSVTVRYNSGFDVNKDYTYNAADDIVLYRNFAGDVSGNILNVSEYNSSFHANGNLDRVEISQGPTLQALALVQRDIYTYNGNDFTFLTENYNTSLSAWLLTGKTEVIAGPTEQKEIQRSNYSYDITLDSFLLNYQTTYEYDAQQRRTSATHYFDPHGGPGVFPNISRTYYNYLQGEDLHHATTVNIDFLTGNETVNSKEYYFYKIVSSTGQPLLNADAVKISPNPATDYLRIDAGENEILAVDIFDQSGRLVWSQSVDHQPVILRNIPLHGLYTLRVTTQNGVASRQVLFSE